MKTAAFLAFLVSAFALAGTSDLENELAQERWNCKYLPTAPVYCNEVEK